MLSVNTALKSAFTANENQGTLSFVFVFFALFIFALVFVAGLVVDAAIHLNSIQIIATSVFNGLILCYSIVQIFTVYRLKSCIESYNSTSYSSTSSTKCQIFSVTEAACNCPTIENWNSTIGAQFGKSKDNFNTILPFEIAVTATMFLFTLGGWYITHQTRAKWGWRVFESTTGADLVKRG
ncbi:hypothetical protein HK096_002335 [Nowakowskiella sp. JEL0078]|nr:hypothetical protein HK096_002335 [Nowakowskiella sp. JEL0078]